MGYLFGLRIIPEAQFQRCSSAIPSLTEQTRARVPGSAPSARRFTFFPVDTDCFRLVPVFLIFSLTTLV
jgi:hypothetical protein